MDTEPAGLTRMPIRDILWSNPEWFRSSLGDVEPLTKSIKGQGLQVPILVTEDLLVIDGARRITAYTSMGRKEIPVVVSSDWDQVIGHLERTRVAEATGLPFEYMDWEDLDTLWRLAIVPLYGPKKITHMLDTRKAKKSQPGPREIGPRPRPGTFAVNDALGRAFAIDPAAIKTLRDAFAALRAIEEKYHPSNAQKKALRALITQVEDANPRGLFKGIYGLRNVLREFSKGTLSLDEIQNVTKARGTSERPKNRVGVWESNRRRNPPTESEIITNFCTVLTQFGEEAQRLQRFDEDLDAEPLTKQLRTAVNRFNALRRRLESGATTGSEQES